MFKKICIILFGIISCFHFSYATQPIYHQDLQESEWSVFHYTDHASPKITSCFALANNLAIGLRSNSEGVGLLVWDKQGRQIPNDNKKVAITVGKQHFIFTMKAMDKNMLMNRLDNQDFKHLLQALSYGQIALIEYGQKPIDIVDLSGIPNILNKFHECILQAGFINYK